jgi:two-component system response regulator TctD
MGSAVGSRLCRGTEGARGIRTLLVGKRASRTVLASRSGANFVTWKCDSAQTALQSVQVSLYDIILIDAKLPDLSGAETCRALRTNGVTAAVILLVERDDDRMHVAALEAGANDVVFPDASPELLALRLTLHSLRNLAGTTPMPVPGAMARTDLGLEAPGATLRRIRADLTRTEERLLESLVLSHPCALRLDQLARVCWRQERVSEHTIHVHLSRLRRKLGQSEVRLRHARGVGYYLEMHSALQ